MIDRYFEKVEWENIWLSEIKWKKLEFIER